MQINMWFQCSPNLVRFGEDVFLAFDIYQIDILDEVPKYPKIPIVSCYGLLHNTSR